LTTLAAGVESQKVASVHIVTSKTCHGRDCTR